jgi:hypothetical protein
MELAMQDHSDNQYWRLSATELQRYMPRLVDEDREVAAHKARILAEEAEALLIYPQVAHLLEN